MVKREEKLPSINILTFTSNAEETIEKCMESVFNQDYPLNKIEWIIVDGNSSDKTQEIIERFQEKYPKVIKFYKEPNKSYNQIRGYNLFARKIRKDFVLFIDQDNVLIQKKWLREMSKILNSNREIAAVQSRWAINSKGSVVEKYLDGLGIEDSFAIPYSLNSQVTLNPGRFEYQKEGDYYIYEISKDNFLYAGGGGFMIKRGDFFNSGGWIQDIDLFYRMGMNCHKVAIPRNLKIYKKTFSTFKEFLINRGFHVQYYLSKNYEGRDFYWFDLEKNNFKQNWKFIENVLKNILFFPGLIRGIKMSLKKKENFWLIHPFMVFSITLSYIFVKLLVVLKEKRQ